MKKKEPVLKAIKKGIVLRASTARDPKEFYQDRTGLWVGSDFTSRLVEKATPVKKDASFKLSSFDLTAYATDKMIESELPKKHLFNESDVCAIIAELISKYPKGQDGPLQNNGYANLFYTKGCVVGVHWYGGSWLVLTWRRDGRGWGGGRRVFSPQLI